MTHDSIGLDESEKIQNEKIQNEGLENEKIDDQDAPPLCLVHYFAASATGPPERDSKPPGGRLIGRIAERRGNMIILEFSPPPKAAQAQRGGSRKRLLAKAGDWFMLLLFLTCLLGCLAAFRF